MGKRIVVNAGLTETRVAVQDGTLITELYFEREGRRSIVGSVHKGVVTNVLPGMQAAFVDIGLTKDAFLYAGDYTANLADEVHDGGESGDAVDEDTDVDVDVDEPEPRREVRGPIEEVLRKGQEVLVQVSKESLGTKGARITSFISLPGRYLVYMPQAHRIGVSRRIRDEAERDRLRAAVRGVNPPPGGFIVRTNAEGKGALEFAADVEFLGRLWAQIQARYEERRPPAVLHEEGDLTFRVVRDLLAPDVDEFLIDDREVYERCAGYVQSLVPGLAERVKRYEGRPPIFEAFGIEKEIDKALRRRVWLKSGGYIVIDHTEALVSIDVNTGKYVGKRDFIDMEVAEHREQVEKALKRALSEDKARTNVLAISELGLVEMTRKRVRQDLRSLLTESCPVCRGAGVVKSSATLAAEVFRGVQARAADAAGREVVVRVHPAFAEYLDAEHRDALARLAQALEVKVTIQAGAQESSREHYEVTLR